MDYTPKIKKEDLKHGHYYKGRCRNATVARWNAEKGCFIHWRTKYTFKFLEEIKCPEDEQYYDVFVTEYELETVEEEIPLHP